MRLPLILLALTLAPMAEAQIPCGGSFGGFVDKLKAEARDRGHDRRTVERFFAPVRQDERTLRADRAQGVFQLPFTDFARRVISQNRIDNGRRNAERWKSVFDRIERDYGVSRGVLLAFWALETDYGQVQGDFNTLNSLVTLGHDCRRPELFQPQIFAALELYEHGDFDPATTTGAWAGEIGMVQMLPGDIIENGVDGDGDGHVLLKTSPPDALMSGAKMLQSLGWRAGEPWLQEITVPRDLDWSETGIETTKPVREWERLGIRARQGSLGPGGMQASVILPQGRNGPAFLAYPNFSVFFEWNQSFVYVTTAAYFATRLEGAQPFDAGNPAPGLSDGQMKELQRKLAARGHDVGGIDGILGAQTRIAVQKEQRRLGMPADAWPTAELLGRL
ncbi:MAG: lytic murein transglycosylase [Rhodobacteraceae bacterium]|nr:lytic murein transglycosylase [Paracoccaceae bacterium]